MGVLKRADAYWKLLGQCAQCGHCVGACESLQRAGMTLGDIAAALLEHDRQAGSADELRAAIAGDGALTQAVRGCFFCTSCEGTCFAHNDVCGLAYAAREDFQDLGLVPREAWSSVLVDQQWHIFSAYRAVHGIWYTDLVRHVDAEGAPAETGFDVAFFPGCSLAAYGPELTREAFGAVEALGGRVTMIDRCCGSSLKSAGFYDRALELCDRTCAELAAAGARELVCVCPGCANDLRAAIARAGLSVRVVSLAAFLHERGFAPARPLPEGPVCLAKSCQDRDGAGLDEMRAALGLSPEAPVVFRGCCGAGGAVSAFDPEGQERQVERKLAAVPDGATLVTMCPTCTYTYAFHLQQHPRAVANKHYAELLFESQFDWDDVFGKLNGMWYGEYGAWLAQVLA